MYNMKSSNGLFNCFLAVGRWAAAYFPTYLTVPVVCVNFLQLSEKLKYLYGLLLMQLCHAVYLSKIHVSWYLHLPYSGVLHLSYPFVYSYSSSDGFVLAIRADVVAYNRAACTNLDVAKQHEHNNKYN